MYLENVSGTSVPTSAQQSARCKYKRIQPMVEQLKDSDAVVVRVVFASYEYKNVASARVCFRRVAKRVGLDIRTVAEDGALFLVKK